MYLSKYNISVADFPFCGGVSLYNLITKGLVFLEDKILIDKLEDIDEETILEMYEKRMLFENQDEEKNFIAQVMTEKYNVENKLDITVVTSHACNLKCTYCFEGESSNARMTIKNAQAILEEIDNFMKENMDAEIAIRYYGGEPMTNLDVIDYMNEYLSSQYEKRFSFSLVSNGVLLTSDIINNWSRYNWSGIKITLDGDREYNDSRRISKNGESTYDRIMQCLVDLPNNIEIFLHIVVDNESIDHLDKMFQELTDKGLQQKVVIGISYTHPYITVPPRERAEAIIRVAQKVKQYGFFLSNLISVDGEGICPNKNHNSFLVDIDGRKFKCTGYMSMKECAAGLYHGNTEKYVNRDVECLECRYLPVCNGGCQFLKSYNNGIKFCQKEYFDTLIPQLLKVYVDYDIA